MNTKVHFSSNTPEWSTPLDFFAKLNEEFNFDLDPCSTKENAKCERYFTKEEDGLTKAWTGRVFMNPPYGRGIGAWVKKAYESVERERERESGDRRLPTTRQNGYTMVA
jgi:phage N-6-adenine-methyltransferase